MNSAKVINSKNISWFLLAAGLWIAPVRAETIIIDDFDFSVANVPSGSLEGVLSGRWGVWDAATSGFVQTVTSSPNAGYVDLSGPEMSITLNQTIALNHPSGSLMALAIFTDGSGDAQTLNYSSATHRLVLTDPGWLAPAWANNANMVSFSFSPNTVARVGSYLYNGGNEILTLAGISHPVVSSPTEATGTVYEAFSYQIEANGSPTGFSASGLPTGLFLDEATGLISGTPANAGTFAVTVRATNSAGTGELVVSLTIELGNGQWTMLSYPGARSTYVAGLSGSNVVGFYDGFPDGQGEVERHGFRLIGTNWAQLRPTNSLRSEARGVSSNRIVGTLTLTNNQKRGYLWTNGVFTLLEYPGSTETRAYGIDGNQIVGDWKDTNSVRRGFLRTGSTWTSLSFPGAVATSARGISGNRIVGEYTDAFGNVRGFLREGTNWTSLTMTNPIPFPEDPSLTWNATEISAKSLSGNTVVGELLGGAGQSAAFLYQGGRWQILNSSGHPAVIVYAIEGNRLGGFSLESLESGSWQGFVHTLPAPVVTLTNLVSATNGTPLSLPVTANNAPASFAATNLPPGLTLNTSNGLISGTPTWPGEYTATITASNASGTGSKQVNFSIQNLQLRLPAQGSFSRQLTAPGGAANFQASDLPGGLNLSASGLLSGTPTNSGYFTATLTASNATGVFTSQIAFTVFRTNLVVTGRVVTPSNTPVASLPLRLVHPMISRRIFASATTSSNGVFQLTAPSDRDYQIVLAEITNANTPPTRFVYPVQVFSDPLGSPVDAGDIQAVPLDRTIRVRMVDAYSGEPIIGTNLTRMGAAALTCRFFPMSDDVAIWMLHQIQIQKQKSFWKLSPEERSGLRTEVNRLVAATSGEPTGAESVAIDWSFLTGSDPSGLPESFYKHLSDNENWKDDNYGAAVFRYLVKTNAEGIYEVPVAAMGGDPRVRPTWTQGENTGLPGAGMEFWIDAPEAVRGKVVGVSSMVYEQGSWDGLEAGYGSTNPLLFDLRVRPAPRTLTGKFYRSNGTSVITNGEVLLEQWLDYPFRNLFFQSCWVDSRGQFQLAVPEDGLDDWRITGEERSDTQVNAYGYNYFLQARQYLQVRSNDVTGLRLVTDQAPAIASIQNGRAGETFRVTGDNLASLGEVSLIPQPSSGDQVVTLPVINELWTVRRGPGFVEFGLPDYLPPGSYAIQYQYPSYAGNFKFDNFAFTTVTTTNVFTVSASTNTNSLLAGVGELMRLPIRYGAKQFFSLTLSNMLTGSTLMLQPRSITPGFVEIQLPQDADMGNWNLDWGNALSVTALTLNDPTPVISLNPVDQAVTNAGTAQFAVGATGAQPLRYQWIFNGTNLVGATNSSLQITNARAIHQGNYAAVVSNWVGSVTSTVASLSVRQPPQILTQPRGTNLIAGQSVTLTVQAEGSSPLAYQWRKGGTNLGGANGSTLALNSVSDSDAGNYSVLISNTLGSVVSSNAVVTVVSPPQFAVQAANGLRGNLAAPFRYEPIVTGSPATFTSSNLPAGLTVNRSNGVISGTPANAAYTRFSLTATNAAGAATLPLALTVPAAPSALPLVDGFTSSVPNRYMVADISELLGDPEYFPQAGRLSLAVTNGVLRLICPTNSLGFHSLAWVPGVSLPLSSPWEILLDVQVPNNYLTQESQLGFTVFPALQPAAALPETNSISYLKNLGPDLNFYLNRDTEFTGSLETENLLERTAYINNEDQDDCHAILPFPSLTNATLRIAYRADQKTLSTWGRANPGGEWIKVGGDVDFNPANSNSLAQRWDLATNASLQFALTAYFEITNASALPPIFADNLIARAGVGPAIATQPRAANVAVGGTATLAVTASGPDPFFYQWRLNGTNLTGATNASLRLDNLQAADGGLYSAVVSNLFGSVTSSNARLTVIQPPVFPPQATNGLRGNLGQAFSFVPVLSNGPAVFTAAGLTNSGLTVNRTNGGISGTPTAAGYYRVMLTASNAAGTATLPVSITVPGTRLTGALADNFSTVTPNRYLPFNFYSPGSMRITNGAARFVSPADGTNGSTAGLVLNLPLPLTNSWDVSADVTLPNGWVTPEVEIGISLDTMFGTNDTVESILSRGQEISLVLNRDTEIEGSNNVRRSVYVGGEDQESLRTTLTNDAVTNARLRFVYQTNGRSLRAWVQTNSTAPWVAVGDALDMNPSTVGSLAQRWGLSNGSSLFLTLTAYAQGGTGTNNLSLDNLSIGAPVPPVITSTGNLIGQVGQSLTYTNRATNGQAEFASTNLPDGLTLNPATGLITGTPENAGMFSNLVISATGPAGTGRRTNPAVILPAFTSTNAVAGFLNDANFRHTVGVGANNFGSNLKFSATGLPTGMVINANSGVISGKPTVAGTFPATVTITAFGASASQRVDFTIQGAAGGAFSLTLNPRPTNVLNLPAGLSYNKGSGVISGTPQGWGSFTATGQLSNGTTTNIHIPVMPSVPVIAGPTNWNAQVGQETRYQIVAGGFGREWAGWDDFNGVSPSTNWLSSGPLAAFRTNASTKSGVGNYQGRLTLTHAGTTNQTGSGYLVWARTIPVGAKWTAMLEAGISTNLNLVRRTNNLGQATNGQWIATKLSLLWAGSELTENRQLSAEFVRSPEEGNMVLARTNSSEEIGESPVSAASAALGFRFDLPDQYSSLALPEGQPGWQTLHSLSSADLGLQTTNQIRLALGGFSEFFLLSPGLVWMDNFVVLPDPDSLIYRAYLVGTNGLALTNEVGEPYLPEGFDFDSSSGSIQGIPSASLPGGTYRIRVEAEYNPPLLPIQGLPPVRGGTNVTLTLLPAFTGTNAATFLFNTSNFTHTVGVGSHNFGSGLRFTAAGLPTGLAIHATSGVIAGRPTAAGTYAARVTITSGTATAFQDLLLSVHNDEGNVWAVGSPVSYQVNLGTGVTGYQATGLPAGLTINAAGLITGTPREVGEYTVTVSVPSRGLSAVIPFFIRPIYVNLAATGSNNGISWANAYTNLQTAIDAAGVGSQIWVAAGTYKPTKYIDPKVTNDVRSRSFVLKGGVSVLGGFAGTETALSQRDLANTNHLTVLSGDFLGNDSTAWPPDSTRGENAYHVLVALGQAQPVVVDGFLVTGGHANNSSYVQPSNGFVIPGGVKPHEVGGGGIILNTDFVIRNSWVEHNAAATRGGFLVYNLNPPTVRKFRAVGVVFHSNLATYGDGGALDIQADNRVASTTGQYMVADFVRCIFESNEARTGLDKDVPPDGFPDGGQGGAVCLRRATANFANCVFVNNFANGNGIRDSSNNPQAEGGAVYARGNCTLRIANSLFTGNRADREGGAVSMEVGVAGRLDFNVFYANRCTSDQSWGATGLGAWYDPARRDPANSLTGSGNIFWQNLGTGQEISWRANSGIPPAIQLTGTIVTAGSLENHVGTVRGGNPNFVNLATPEGSDGIWFTEDDGLRIRAGSSAFNWANGVRPNDFADLDEDGNTTELLPYDAAGVSFSANPPYQAGAYQTVVP